MKLSTRTVGCALLIIVATSHRANAFPVWGSTYDTAIKERDDARRERDEARRERDEARAKYEELLKKMAEEAKTANPELRDAALKAQREHAEAERRANQVQLDREADAAQYSKTLTLWKTGGAVSVAAVGLVALIAGVAIGTRTRRDFRSQQVAARPESVAVSQGE